jgi:AhpD family alkylhydroperoxidase
MAVRHDNSKETAMQPRMKNPLAILPNALKGLLAVDKATEATELPLATRKLVHLRASQINGCGFCNDMHAKELKKANEKDERIFAVAAWRDTNYFSPAERAALALTEAVTRLDDRSDAVPDDVWEEAAKHYDEKQLAALLIQIGLINMFNRVNVPIRQIAGSW